MTFNPLSAFPRQGSYVPPVEFMRAQRAINEPNWAGPRAAGHARLSDLSAQYRANAAMAYQQHLGGTTTGAVMGLQQQYGNITTPLGAGLNSAARRVSRNRAGGDAAGPARQQYMSQRDAALGEMEAASSEVINRPTPVTGSGSMPSINVDFSKMAGAAHAQAGQVLGAAGRVLNSRAGRAASWAIPSVRAMRMGVNAAQRGHRAVAPAVGAFNRLP